MVMCLVYLIPLMWRITLSDRYVLIEPSLRVGTKSHWVPALDSFNGLLDFVAEHLGEDAYIYAS